MAVYREGYAAIELINSASKQIFTDACDYGAPVKIGDRLWNAAKQLVDWYGVDGSRKEHRYPTGRSVEQKVELMDEWAVSDGRKTEEQATENFLVQFVSCSTGLCKGFDGFLTITKC